MALLHMIIQILVCVLIGVETVDGQSYENATYLKSSLLASYDTDIRPLTNQSETLNVSVMLMLYSQLEVNPVRGSISTALVLSLFWIDEQVSWTPSQHYGIENFNIKSSAVWTPAISIAQSMTFEPFGSSWMRVKYNYTGLAEFTPGDVYETSCKFNMRYWPFDKHACYLTFFSYDYALDKIKISANSLPTYTNYYIQNGEWFLKTDSIEYRIGQANPPSITYRLIYERQPNFYLITVIIPMNAIGALNCLAFLLPNDGRVGFSVTIMLSLSVFLTVVTDELPKTADPVPVMCVYVLFSTLFSIIVALIVILSNMIHTRDKTTRISLPYKIIVKVSRFGRNKIENKQDNAKNLESIGTQMNVQEVKEENEDDTSVFKAEDTDSLTWQEVSNAIDRIMFCTSIIAITIPAIIIVMSLAFASDYEKDSIYWTF